MEEQPVYKELTARKNIDTKHFIIDNFPKLVSNNDVIDTMNFNLKSIIAFSGLKRNIPILQELFKDKSFLIFIKDLFKVGSRVLLTYKDEDIKGYIKKKDIEEFQIPNNIKKNIKKIYKDSLKWGGALNENGEHIIDLKSPRVGPHFGVNLLMGNRIGFENVLQTTPKSVVDMLGRGSFRSHADKQVLATRWDVMPEENGFPANRQFYLYEGLEKIFYSAEIENENIIKAYCKHSQNSTSIYYKLKNGLEVERIIYILPQDENLPLATEVQRIKIYNTTNEIKNIRIVYTGMFGSIAHGAMYEDVIYTNVIMQSKIIKNDDDLLAIIPDYYPNHCKGNTLFHSSILHNNNEVYYPEEFCTNYYDFIGNGTLENPKYGIKLNNKMNRKGPGFFANAIEFSLPSGGISNYDNFTGLVDSKNYDVLKQIKNIIEIFSKENSFGKYLEKNALFYNKYKNFLQIKTADNNFNSYINNNLPFQVLYQTFMSRSFCQTQKGYREIGFREIQDLFSSMNYFISSNNINLVKDLIKQWAKNVYKMGFANHNFYWVGKEPGIWSDDAIWLVNAVYRYIKATKDFSILNDKVSIYGTKGEKRTLIETLNQIIVYSSEISVGKNGFPLIDYADWNDCLKVDKTCINGLEKEKKYLYQLKTKKQSYGTRIESDSPESIMNAFLLKVSIDNLYEIYLELKDKKSANKMKEKSKFLYNSLNKLAWKNDYFARVLFNKNDEIKYLGSKGDGFSSNPKIDGTYFLNSFSWSILSNVANDEKIEKMLINLEKYLKTDYGFKLVTESDLSKVSEFTATGEYFYGDRENGAIFKHAAMMAVTAMFKSAKRVKNKELAEKLTNLAYWMIDLALPFKTLENPFVIYGNPRFCTQYNNSKTGENMGPMLSGTATWLNLAILESLGFEINQEKLLLNPVLRVQDKKLNFEINKLNSKIKILITKNNSFKRVIDENYEVYLNGKIQNLHDNKEIKIDLKEKINNIELNFI
jgi:nitrogen fixation protein